MGWIVVSGVKPWDGRYEFDPNLDYTTREWGWIKRLAGYMPLTADQGLDGGDPELFAVFAVIAMRRAGTIDIRDVPEVFERISDAPFGGTVTFESDPADTEEGDAGPPAASSSGNGNTSGAGSPASSATPAGPPSRSGTPASDSTASHPIWSAT